MSNNFKANPTVAPAYTKPGESKEYVGTRNVTDLLPVIFQTTVNKKFLESTLEQLMSSGSLQAINNYVGEKIPNAKDTDRHLDKNRQYQFVPSAINTDADQNVTNALTYEDFINALQFNEAQLANHNTALDETGYTLDLPINYDMFVNHHRYFWVLNTLPVCELVATSADPITIDDITAQTYYTTPTLNNGKTLELQNGMRIRFAPVAKDQIYQTVTGNTTFTSTVSSPSVRKVFLNNERLVEGTDYTASGATITFTTAPAVNDEVEIWSYWADGTNYAVDDIYIVDGVGSIDGIHLTKQFDNFDATSPVESYGKRVWFNTTIYGEKIPSQFDADDDSFDYKPFDISEFGLLQRDYTVEERYSQDQSAWARSNLWVHEQVAEAVCTYTDTNTTDYLLETARAVRPIIEFRANMEKYEFGYRHLTYVNHVFNTIADPATAIEGQPSFSFAAFMVNGNDWTAKGYNKGDLVRVIKGSSNTTYWECKETHAEALDPTHYENQKYWQQIIAEELENDDLVLISCADSGSYRDKIYRVGGVGTSITLTEAYNFDGSGGAVQIQENDKIVVLVGHNIIFKPNLDDEFIFSGSEWYWGGNGWIYGQQKDHASKEILFDLFDVNQVQLDFSQVYPNSNFAGDYIFRFGRGTGRVDEALGFAPRYVDYGNNPGLDFDIGLGAVRYQYNKINENSLQTTDSNVTEDIEGFYFYKMLDTGQYHNGWREVRNGQRVQLHQQFEILEPQGDLVVDLGTLDINTDDTFHFAMFNNNLSVQTSCTANLFTKYTPVAGSNPVLFMSNNRTYTIETDFDITDLEIVNFDGTVATNVTRINLATTLAQFTITSTSTRVLRYRLVSDTSVTGLIYVDSNTNFTTIEMLRNGEPVTNYTISGQKLVTSFYAVGDTIDVYWSTLAPVVDTTGEFLPADTHIMNPQNGWLTTASYGDLQQHIEQQVTGIPVFTGDYFGRNNYKEIPHVHEFGGTIRKQPFSTEIAAQTLMDTDTNFYSSLKYVSQNYRKFIDGFLRKVAQLHKSVNDQVPTYALVDQALRELNLGKSTDLPFANSNMVLYRDYEEVNYIFDSAMSTVFELPETVNTYNDTSNHIQAWLYDIDGNGNQTYRSMIKGVDYTLTNNKLTLLTTVNYDTNNQAEIVIRWYPVDSASFVPPSAAKLGLVRPQRPSIVSNVDRSATGDFSTRVMVLHDGSYYDMAGTELYDRNAVGYSVQDAALWELETRIYNNLNSELNTVVDYKEIMPNGNARAVHSWQDLTLALTPEFNKWKTRRSITALNDSSYYNPLNAFTWNYSSVGPGIGGYKGLYVFYFNTASPHTTPWEMFGYTQKPSWWDTYYSWTDATKRAALIEALTYGHYNNPAESVKKYSKTYRYNSYGWQFNTLVTTAGTLNDPVTAGVVPAPNSADAAKDFVFGDYGPVEAVWRDSSEYKTELFIALARLRPLWVTNTYFSSTNRRVVDTQNLYTPVIVDTRTNQLTSIRDTEINNAQFDDSIIEKVKVTNGGSGYTSAPVVNVYSNFGSGASIELTIESGTITSASVVSPGKNYQSKPLITVDTGSATFEATLLDNARKYFVGLNNAISEWAISNKQNLAEVQTRFENLKFAPTIRAGGFINPNNQTLILESSQDKGRATLPEENYTTILHTSQPKEELFFGAVDLTKTELGVIVTGYDNNRNVFSYRFPMKTTKKSILNIGDERIEKYKLFEDDDLFRNYNTEIIGLQNLYDFLIGYGHRLNLDGWLGDWSNSAARAIEWSSTASVGDTYSVIPNTRQIGITETNTGYFDNISKKYDGVYNVIDNAGRQITSNRIVILRDNVDQEEPQTVISIRETGTQIHGVRLYKVGVEHLIVLDNVTDFDDVIYNPELGQRHKRIIWRGARTKNWNGKLFAPGYLVTDNTIVNNFDTTAREIDQTYGPGNTINNQQLVDVARFNIGYNKPEWSLSTDLDDDTVFNFTRGSLKYKGTRFAVDAFVRNNTLFEDGATVDLHEEWAIRTADYGDIRSRDTVEFQLTKDLITTNPQPVRFTEGELNDVLTDLTVDIDSNSNLLVSGSLNNVFDTRDPKVYTYGTISQEEQYAADFVTAGLPLTTETDYRILNRTDFASFPEETRDAYTFDGDWQDIEQWDNKTSYKFKDRVIYEGRVWEMLDPDGSSGLNRPNDPITITGTVTLPVVPSTGQTLVIDGNTVTIGNSSNTTTFDIIQVTGTNDIATTASVPNGSTIILGETSADAVTVQFSNVINTTVYSDVIKIGTVINPTIQASNTAELIIDSTSIKFDDTVPSAENITANNAFTDAFATAISGISAPTINTLSVTRVNVIENLRVAYQAATSVASWSLFLNSYFTGGHGPNVSALLTELATSPTYSTQLEAFITHDVDLINQLLGRSYSAANVIAGTETVSTADETAAKSALAQGQYIDDVTTWLKNNLTTIFQTTTVVATASSTQFITYDLQAIIDKINAAGIPRITASADNDRLKITKASNNSTTRFSLVITSAANNSDVGFSTTTETLNSTGTNVVSTPNLTIGQVVDQINAAQIQGISARISQTNTSLLQIISNNDSLYIGNGNANSIIGITQGVTLASTTVSVTATTSAIGDIIDSINTANISGVTASNSNNKVRIVSTNPTLVIGAGTANTTIGITAQTYTATQTTVSNIFNAIVGSDGQQVFREMDNDPNVFSMWIADNNDEYRLGSGYAVMQTMDFDMYITKACAGINDADEALVQIARPAGNTQFHNLQENDYVLIRGSNTVPSIDGIHRVTKVDTDSNLIFYIDEFIEQEGDAGNVYPIRNVRFASYDQLLNQYNTKVNDVYKYNFADVRQNDTRKPIYAFVDNDGTGRSAVYKWTGSWSDGAGHFGDTGWVKVRNNFGQARNDLIDNIRVYDAQRKSLITTIETFDPAKGILPGFLDSEIDFKTTADVAGYNFNSVSGSYENTKAWDDKQVGTRWWDLTTSIFLDYEQGSIDYQQNNWGRLFDGASVDVYEWTRSPVLPEQWQQLVDLKTVVDGNVASGEAYSKTVNGETIYNWTEKTIYNNKTKQSETVYYFWVKNKTNFSGIRNYNTRQLSVLISDPDNFNITWCAAAGSDKLFISNISQYLDDNTVIQINKKYESNALDLEEWTLLSENDPDSIIPEYFHIKIRDSLAGYDNSSLTYTYVDYSVLTNYNKNDVVIKDGIYYICLADNVLGVDPAADTTMTNWKRIYDYSIIDETLHDDIEVLANQSVPDIDLHPFNRYGHLKRPRQSLYRDITEARQNFVSAANNILKDICIVNDIIGWHDKFTQSFTEGTVTYEIDKYWSYIDWVARTYSPSGALLSEYNTSEVADYTVARSTELASVVAPDQYQNGMTVYVRESIGSDGENRPEIYMYEDTEWRLVWKKNGTIKLSEELWNQSKYGKGFDAIGFDIGGFDDNSSNIIVKIFDILYNDILVGQFKTKYNKLWFACLHQAVTQNTTDDFAFKTTNVKLQVNKPLVTSREKYRESSIRVLEDYFNSIKPYHTKLRSSLESNTFGELVGFGITEESRNSEITMVYNDHTMADWELGDTILNGGDFLPPDIAYVIPGYVDVGYLIEVTDPSITFDPVTGLIITNEDTSEFTTVDSALEYVYNGNNFIQPNYEGWGEELYPADFTENIRIRVQTNASGSIETADTRTFQINILEQHDVEESIAIVQSSTATVQTAVAVTDTDIELVDASMLYQPAQGTRGVVWIGTERVTYGAIENNTLRYCNRGTYATAAQEHTAGTLVIDASVTQQIPTPANFAHYGDGLRLAYNDSGVSLSSAGTTPEHAFIRNAGFGTL